ncbi:TIGR04222 domain-containing membrane protein [Amycolatopsis samaneae]|uniref:TIGR04222 domain-containing membrane protein n=1 Tax=Amycolatopsis samaneae TaxID=664691 RepID=A0ABW5GRE8_9PSEU
MDEWWRVLCLLGYVVASVAAVGWAVLLRWGPRRAVPSRPLSVDEVACLLGGAARLAETAIVRLVDQGTLRVSSSGLARVAGADLASARQNRVDAAVLRQLSQWRPTPVAAVARDAAGEPEFAAVRSGLAELGLVAGGRAWLRRRRLALGAVLVVFAVGAVWLVAETGPRRPEGWLLVCLAAVVISPLWWASESRAPGTLTGAGRQVAARARAGVATAGLWSTPAGLVALGGPDAHPDPGLRAYLRSTTTEYAIPRAPLPSSGRPGPAASRRRSGVRGPTTGRHQGHWGGGCGTHGGDGGSHGGHGCGSGGDGCGGGDG